jgi:hypothetical protein
VSLEDDVGGVGEAIVSKSDVLVSLMISLVSDDRS